MTKVNDFATTTTDGLIAATRFYSPGTKVSRRDVPPRPWLRPARLKSRLGSAVEPGAGMPRGC